MLRFSFDMSEEADCIERAISAVLDEGYRTADIAGAGEETTGCREMGALIRSHLAKTEVH